MTQNVEIGAGWPCRGDNGGKDYVSLSLAAPEFGPRKLYAKLGRAAGPDADSVFALTWSPVDWRHTAFRESDPRRPFSRRRSMRAESDIVDADGGASSQHEFRCSSSSELASTRCKRLFRVQKIATVRPPFTFFEALGINFANVVYAIVMHVDDRLH